MPVVTIRGQFGSGAPEIGRLVAEKIGGDYVDREIIARVAEKLSMGREQVAALEQPAGGLWGRIAHALERSMAYGGGMEGVYAPVWQVPTGEERYVDALASVIKELAQAPAIVIRGRGSQFILKDHPGALHVLVVAPVEVRVRTAMETLKLDQDAAKREMHRSESSHRTFIRRYFGADLEDPLNYDLTLNTWHISYEAAVQIILEGAAAKG